MKFYTVIAIIIFVPAITLLGQSSGEDAFNTITVSAGYNKNITSGDLDEYWSADKGASVKLEFPFYEGVISVGVDAQIFKSNSVRQPDFKTYLIYLSWQYKLKLLFNTYLRAGIKFGSYVMIFEDVELSEFESNESELGVSAAFQYDVPITKNFSFYIQSDLLTVFTMKRIKLLNAGAGISYNFNSPEWLKDILN